jgi:hypothetical protein
MAEIEIDLTDPTLPDNYLQLRAALERDCAKHAGQMGAKESPQPSNQAGRKVAEKRGQPCCPYRRGQATFEFFRQGR